MTGGVLERRLQKALEARAASRTERKLELFRAEAGELNLSGNDYLGLARRAEVKAAAKEAIDLYGCSASASPLITGFGEPHARLLEAAKAWHGFAHGLVWNSGYAANQAILSHLPSKGDLVLADRMIHNSMISGLLRSGARILRYRHNDMAHLASLLQKEREREGEVFVVTESVFSMDGDYPDLRSLVALKVQRDFFLVVDEAHAIGWYGERGSGLVEEAGVAEQVDLLVGTLGKGLGSMGAYTLFHDKLIGRYLANFAGEFIYSTYLAPACAAAALRAMQLAQEMVEERRGARRQSRWFREELRRRGLRVADGDSPIVPIILGQEQAALEAAKALRGLGLRVGAIRPPTVPAGSSRLRISLQMGIEDERLLAIGEGLEAWGGER